MSGARNRDRDRRGSSHLAAAGAGSDGAARRRPRADTRVSRSTGGAGTRSSGSGATPWSRALLLYALHPVELETRVPGRAKASAYLRSHGGDVELLAIVDGRVRMRVLGYSSTASTVEAGIMRRRPMWAPSTWTERPNSPPSCFGRSTASSRERGGYARPPAAPDWCLTCNGPSWPEAMPSARCAARAQAGGPHRL